MGIISSRVQGLGLVKVRRVQGNVFSWGYTWIAFSHSLLRTIKIMILLFGSVLGLG